MGPTLYHLPIPSDLGPYPSLPKHALDVKGERRYSGASEKILTVGKKFYTKNEDKGAVMGEKIKLSAGQMIIYCCSKAHPMKKCVVMYTLVLNNTTSIHELVS